MKYLFWALLVVVLGYFSVEIKPLDAMDEPESRFDAQAYARNYLESTLPDAYGRAIPINELINALKTDKNQAFEQWSHAIAIGTIGHFLVQGTGSIQAISENEIILGPTGDSEGTPIRLATEFIYGNSIRDAAGLVNGVEFTNTADINALAAEINRIVREERIPKFTSGLAVGDVVTFIGALELNQKFPVPTEFEILPIELTLQ